jgi:hypothetical protein
MRAGAVVALTRRNVSNIKALTKVRAAALGLEVAISGEPDRWSGISDVEAAGLDPH